MGAPSDPSHERGSLRIHLLGRLTVSRDGQPLTDRDLGSRQGRTLLRLLALRRRHVVPLDLIGEILWAAHPPAKWERDVATLASRLRGVLGSTAIEGGPSGYRLVPSAGLDVDLDEAERLTAHAETRSAAGEPALARAAAERALEILGRGAVLEDEPYAEWAEGLGVCPPTLGPRSSGADHRGGHRVGPVRRGRPSGPDARPA